MAFYNGSAALVAIEDTPGSATYTNVGCQRTLSLSINSEEIDVTGKCNMPNKTHLEGGIQSMEISLGGVLDDSASMLQLIQNVGSILNFEITMGIGTYVGAFKIASAELTGEHTDAQQFSSSLSASGAVTFTPTP